MLSFALASSICLTAFAETYYVLDGFTYKIVDYGVSLCGWDYSAEVMSVPQLLGGTRVAEIDDFAFNKDKSITNVDFSNATYLTRIGKMSFIESGLSGTVEITPSVSEIGVGAFQGCTDIESIVYRASAVAIPNQCFKDCSNLSNAEILSGVQSIGAYAFQNCASLQTIIIPKTVESISPSAFSGCDNLTLGVWYDSYAYKYAKDNNISYILLDGVKLGETDGDGHVTISDVTAIQRHIADLELIDGIYLYAADVNRDVVVDITDATELQRFLAEFDVDYPIGEVITQ